MYYSASYRCESPKLHPTGELWETCGNVPQSSTSTARREPRYLGTISSVISSRLLCGGGNSSFLCPTHRVISSKQGSHSGKDMQVLAVESQDNVH